MGRFPGPKCFRTQVMMRLPCAGVPSAMYTVSATVVLAIPFCGAGAASGAIRTELVIITRLSNQ
jgi:hypothetical protein